MKGLEMAGLSVRSVQTWEEFMVERVKGKAYIMGL